MRKELLISCAILFAVTLLCFRLVFTGRVPIPADIIVGLYHPFRDAYAKEYPRGIPFKNPLIGDSVSQQIPWRVLSFEQISKAQLPLWNPYSMAGYPLLGNIQSAPFYPLNVVFLLLPFIWGWTSLIILQPLLGSIFMFLYLRNLKLLTIASLFGGITFGFSGFFLSWLEWGTIAHTALWFPLAFLAIDYITQHKKNHYRYAILLFISLAAAYLAGHLQTFVYGSVITALYGIMRLWRVEEKKKNILLFGGVLLAFLVILFPVWFSQLQLLLLSARDIDLNWTVNGWFIPREHIVQFIAPDFFGNPATGNYFGEWNYGEFLGYVGILPLFFAFIGVTRKNRISLFFAVLVLISLLFSVRSPLAKIPYLLDLPLFSSTQPTRLLFITDFALAVLAAFGLHRFIQQKRLSFGYPALLVVLLGGVVLFGYLATSHLHLIEPEQWKVTVRNLILPTVLTIFAVGTFVIWRLFGFQTVRRAILFGIILVTVLDLLFIANKYNSFSQQHYFYPSTKALSYLQQQTGNFRIMTTTRTILHPNFHVMYKLESINGYDPLYLERYGELMAAMGRRKPDISRPFGFFRIVAPDAYDSRIVDMMGVRYILSNTDLTHPKLTKVYQEGETQIYENKEAYRRAFFVKNIVLADTKQDALNLP